jgi:hypothetical protein
MARAPNPNVVAAAAGHGHEHKLPSVEIAGELHGLSDRLGLVLRLIKQIEFVEIRHGQ